MDQNQKEYGPNGLLDHKLGRRFIASHRSKKRQTIMMSWQFGNSPLPNLTKGGYELYLYYVNTVIQVLL